MKKKYMEPQMIVEDFTVSEMVAKCELISNNTFISGISHKVSACRSDAPANAAHPMAYQIISSFANGEDDCADFDNVDGDNNWVTNTEVPSEDSNRMCFLTKFRDDGFCTFDAGAYTFMNYAHNPVNAEDNSSYIDPCTPGDNGSSLLQNS